MHKQVLGLVFSRRRYTALAIGVSCGLFALLSYMSQFIFFEPEVTLYVPQEGIPNFVLIVAISSLSGVVSSLSTYRILWFGESMKKSSGGFLGTMIGAGAGACSCSSIGFAAASAMGAVGGTATALLTQYEIPLRFISIAVLGYAYIVAVRGISGRCKIRT
ncbi:MAG TPA: hypothetical protein VJ792_09855 [Candidatus Nitrosotalea sp.]|nr:hypothetical protein [Candidatus Nitrosotalea sp.]